MHGSCSRSRSHHRPRVERPSAAPEPLVPADDLRASDAERERIVAALREQSGEGRLTVEELDERLGRAYAAKTRAELAALTSDLPVPAAASPAATSARDEFQDHLRTYLLVMVLLVGIWAAAGAGYFWPVWPALGWGIGVASHWAAVRSTPQQSALRAQRGALRTARRLSR